MSCGPRIANMYGSSRRPRQSASAKQMNMQVEDRLPSAGPNVQNGTVSLLDIALARDLSGGQVAAPNDFGVAGLRFFQSCKMFFGDDEYMRGRLRTDVFKGEYGVIFVNFLRGNVAVDDSAEKAGRFCVAHRAELSRSRNHSTG